MRPFQYLLLIFGLLCNGCGDLSEQRSNLDKIKEGRQNQEIKRVTEDQILAAAYTRGAALVDLLEGQNSHPASYWAASEGKVKIDSVNRANPGQSIRFIALNNEDISNLNDLEKQFLEAYTYSYEQEEVLSNNVQLIDGDHVLYTAPYLFENRLEGFWSMVLTKRDIVLDMESL